MKGPRTILQIGSGLLLAVVGLIPTFVAPGFCQGRPDSGDGTISTTAQANWATTGSLNAPRSSHTATLLLNGNVLVVGGDNASGVLSSAELYDPATGRWSVTGSLNTARIGHTATLLQNGKVLVSGGVSGGAVNGLTSAEVYDPDTGTWSLTGSLSVAHTGHTATLLLNGKVLVSGGTGDFNVLHTAELYDPAAGTWSQAGSPTWARGGHTATLLQNGSVLVAGGIVGPYDADLDFPAASNAELYDPVAGSWRNVGTAIILYDHTATLLPNGKVLMAGGYSVRPVLGGLAVNTNGAELYDPAGEAWSYSGYLSVSHFRPTASLLSNGKVLVAGGIVFGQTVVGSNVAELYDPDTGMWTGTSSLNVGRWEHTSTVLADGRVLVAGGITGAPGNTTISLTSAELYGDAVVPPGAIGPGFTGSWYDPTQSGHGIFIEVLPNARLLAWWFAFNPAGTERTWFGGVGTYVGNKAIISSVNETTGGRWIPNFDPARIVNTAWGTLTFTFTDCNHGRVDFNSVLEYGTGSMNLARLTKPAGLSCP